MEGSIKRTIASICLKNPKEEEMRVSLAFNKNGKMEVCFTDTTNDGTLDNGYVSEHAFPNSALNHNGRNSLWLSMYSRHLLPDTETDDY